ncbi:MAG: hypothetical protein LBC69_02410 [Eubacteriaceae bacterium]|jgi:hypothetical protein|nr:hypothetical protein [Eubacteriaceae bacterium]
MADQPFQRELSPNERAAALDSDAVLALAVQVDGPLDISKLRKAVEKVGQAFPALNSRILFNSKGRLCFEGLPTPLALVIEDARFEARTVVRNGISIPFSASFGPLARIALIHGQEKTEIAVFAHPAAADSEGLSRIVSLLIGWTVGSEEEAGKASEFALDRKKLRSLLPRFSGAASPKAARLAFMRMSAALGRAGWAIAQASENSDGAVGYAARGECETYFSSGEISESDTVALGELASEKGASLEGILTMSFLKCADRAGGPEASRLSISRDMRDFFGISAEGQAGALTLDAIFDFSYSFDDTLWNNIRRFDESLETASVERREAVKAYLDGERPLALLLAAKSAESESVQNLANVPRSRFAGKVAKREGEEEAEYSFSLIKAPIKRNFAGLTVTPSVFVERLGRPGARLSAIRIAGKILYTVQFSQPKVQIEAKAFVDRTAAYFGDFVAHDVFYSCVNSLKEAPFIVNGLTDEVLLLQN